jgi:hypothetical protein
MKSMFLILVLIISAKMWNLLLFADRWVCKGYDNCGNTVIGLYISDKEIKEPGK